MHFEITYTDDIISGKIIYRRIENSFDIEPLLDVDINILFSNINIGIDSESKIVKQLWGYHPYNNWIKSKLIHPIARKGLLRLCNQIEPGTTIRIKDTDKWKTYINENSGWIYFCDNVNDAIQYAVEIISNCIIVLDNDGVIKSIWLRPMIV